MTIRNAFLMLVLAALASVSVMCDAVTAPGAGLEAGPGSPECRRAIHDWVTHPGDRVYDPEYAKYRDEVLAKCAPGANDQPESKAK